jgi:hypothetical protein
MVHDVAIVAKALSSLQKQKHYGWKTTNLKNKKGLIKS